MASHSPKLHRASISGKKLTGRPPLSHSNSSSALANQISYLDLEGQQQQLQQQQQDPSETPTESKTPDLRGLLSQVVDWLHEEKSRRRAHQHRHLNIHRHNRHHNRAPSAGDSGTEGPSTPQTSAPGSHLPHHPSTTDSDVDISLDKLESILAGYASSSSLSQLPKLAQKSSTSLLSKRGSIAKVFSKRKGSIANQSSDTEFFGDEVLVPNVEATLDNTKTMAFTGGSADSDTSDLAKRRDYEHWVKFKEDIVRLTHTLRLKGWRRIPIDRAAEIDVARLSGALTNAVYVVRPPKNMADYDTGSGTGTNTGTQTPNPSTPGGSGLELSTQKSSLTSNKRKPVFLLLRIYGPQVEHLIDRDSELSILRRLARKRIGPRLLGSFDNGRFEEFLYATTLTAEDIRVPETSKQIAKRMRELHDGIELLDSELDAGPAVFVNWDKWVDRVEKVITWLDQQVHAAEEQEKNSSSATGLSSAAKINPRYTRRGLICGVEWPVFRKTYDAYRKKLVEQCGGNKKLRSKLIFAHNDTQYGNLMRLNPSGTSPLLQPSNQHKQLVVIDFEYAGQNTKGHEFANHFTEWCYNYHHPEKSWMCDTRGYPDVKEQYRFMRSYVMHRPQFAGSASATPKMEAREKTNIGDFMLDARTPGSSSANASTSALNLPAAAMDYDKEEKEREKRQEEEIQSLLDETRLWRLANSAQWVAWGIVQAKVPELDEKEDRKGSLAAAKDVVGGVLDTVKGLTNIGRSGEGEGEDETAKQETEDKNQEAAQAKTNDEAESSTEPNTTTTATTTTDAVSDDKDKAQKTDNRDEAEGESEEAEAEEEEFDYLAYAQDRAMFFWGDCIQMGLVKEEDLPPSLRDRVKKVPY